MMPFLRVAASCLIILCATGTAYAQSQPFDGGTKVQWLPLLVRDMDRALVLYRDILRLDVDDDQTMEASAFVGQVFNIDPSRITRTVKFNADGSQLRVIALYEVPDLSPVEPAAPIQSGWALQIDHYADAYPALSNGDYRVLGTNAWGDPPEDGGEEIVITDTDGHMLIIYATYP